MKEQTYTGRHIEEVLSEIKERNQRARVVERDGKIYCVTMEVVPERYNFIVEKDIITQVFMG